MRMLERTVQRVFRRLTRRVCIAIKTDLLTKGFPDWTLLAPGGLIVFVELKRPGADLEPMQRKWRKRLTRIGFRHEKLDTVEAVEAFFAEWPANARRG